MLFIGNSIGKILDGVFGHLRQRHLHIAEGEAAEIAHFADVVETDNAHILRNADMPDGCLLNGKK